MEVAADRGAEYPCPECDRLCKAHDCHEFTWRHNSFFQHHCYVIARVSWVDCPDHGTKLLEQAAMTLMREMSVRAAACIIVVSDTRFWRVVQFYVAQALPKKDLGEIKAVALDGTAFKRGQNYVTVLIDLDRKQKPVIFVTPGKGKGCLILFRRFLREHGGDHNNIVEVVCDMPPAFLVDIGESFPGANVTVD
ncbi:hypothetical protein DFAR_2650006 [Desulfarculales bacterium]